MAEEPRQRVERVPGRRRRARLTPAPGSDSSPGHPAASDEQPAPGGAEQHPDDERIARERPPHW